MNVKKFLAMGLAAVMAAAVLSGCGGNAVKDGGSSDKGKIVVGLDDNFPPMGFKDENNEIVGFDIDLAKEAAKRMGREVEFKAIDWSSKEAELKSGRVDVLWNGLDITEKRKENMLFSDPYMDNRQILFVKKGTTGITDEKSLAGKVVGTQSAGTAEEYMDKSDFFKKQVKEVKKYPDYVAAFMDLENGRVDAIVGDEITGRYYMSKHPDTIEAVDTAIGEISMFGIAFRKDDQKLRDEVQKVLNDMREDGTMAKISEKWFGKNITK
ncbi:amino acid ABC transporter substrate-binding protein [Selenomonas sp. WCA-380-WT-3B 3/]|uniref:Amino acid ABC transporter substrate-binding protein n=1 Tax=Selenomonas montiformis TaxID=2652285 RepID=A0A6I2V2Q7_9FIRM|nr:amino acid ABC transporter substrate-binding protein [Selenomonas montiformis]MSV25752.1 amino acid ABC transporter substrate-binding protein [Selenomonas montiformis]